MSLKKKILNIDGGGVRVYLSLLILNYIEQRTNKQIIDIFDFYSGVSSSSIILSGLLTKYSVQDMLQQFKEISKKIFNRSYYHIFKSGFGLFDSKYTDTYINEELEKMFLDCKLNDVKKPLSILSYDLISSKPVCFQSYTENNYDLWKIVRSSIAAPTYFPSFSLDKYNLIDGGIVTNNLSELTFIDALEHFGNNEFLQVSIGTGYKTNKNQPIKDNTSGSWYWYNTIVDVMFQASSSYEMLMLTKLAKIEKLKYLSRLDIELPEEIKLDDYTAFDKMDKIFEKWFEVNREYLDDLCDNLIF